MKKLSLTMLVSCGLLMFVFSVATPFTAASAAETKTLKIGLITSITGPLAPTLKAIGDAAKPAQELMNQRGGIMIKGEKYSIEIVVEDDRSSPPGGVAAANKLMQAGIKFIIAPQFPPTNMALASITEEAKVLRIKAMGMGKEEMGPNTRYFFYGTATILQIPTCYDYLIKNYPKVKRIALVTPDDPGIGSNREATEREARKRGLDIVFQESFKIGTEDFYPILTKALEKKPDAIDMIVAIPLWSAGIINQSRELGFQGPVFTAMLGDLHVLNAMINPKYARDVFHAGADVQSPQMKPILKEYRPIVEKDLKTTLNMDHAMLLEALYPLLQGIEKAQSFDTDRVVSTLENMKSLETIYGPGRMGGQEVFGINHVVYRPPMISRIMNGKIEFEFIKQ